MTAREARRFGNHRLAEWKRGTSRWLAVGSGSMVSLAVALAIALPPRAIAASQALSVAAIGLAIAALWASFVPRRSDADLTVDADTLEFTRGAKTQRIPVSRIRSGFVVPKGAGADAELQLDNGNGVTIELESPTEANSLLDAAGLSAQQRSLSMRLGPRWKAALGGVATSFFLFSHFIELVRYGAGMVWGAAFAILTLAFAWGGAQWFGPATVVVGNDGVNVRRGFRRTFIPYAQIRAIDVVGRDVILLLTDGKEMRLAFSSDDPRAREVLFQRIREAAANAGEGARAASVANALDRSGKGFGAWIESLRKAATAGSGYRDVTVTAEDIDQQLKDPRASAEQRIAAAVALYAAEGERAKERIRVVADASACEPVRVALERVMDDGLDEETFERAVAAAGKKETSRE